VQAGTLRGDYREKGKVLDGGLQLAIDLDPEKGPKLHLGMTMRPYLIACPG